MNQTNVMVGQVMSIVATHLLKEADKGTFIHVISRNISNRVFYHSIENEEIFCPQYIYNVRNWKATRTNMCSGLQEENASSINDHHAHCPVHIQGEILLYPSGRFNGKDILCQ
jgi:hypothetical protein